MTDLVVTEQLSKHYRKVKALDAVSLRVPEASVHALLGPNGAGKTTLVRILATLLQPDAGRAWVCGMDVTRQAHAVRAQLALTGQHVAADDMLTGRENLELIARLRRLDGGAARQRAKELLREFALEDIADRRLQTYSGGLRRRLDLALSCVVPPRVLFLDEPTTGLDPHSRHALWHHVQGLARNHGTAIIMTTQYMEEAERLADQITVIDAGRVVADGTPLDFRMRAGGQRVELTVAHAQQLAPAEDVLRAVTGADVERDPQALRLIAAVTAPFEVLAGLARELANARVEIADLALRRPTLDEAFRALTAGPIARAAEAVEERGAA